MTHACFFRYAWIAPDLLSSLLPRSPALQRFSAHVREGMAQACAASTGAPRSGVIGRLREFALRPSLRDLPPRRLLRSAARWSEARGDREAARLIEWCSTLRELWHELVQEDDENRADVTFLTDLAATEFPVLLLWSNSHLARRLFAPLAGRVVLDPAIAADPKACRKAVTIALRYGLGAFGRFGPRDAWIGSGFAVTGGSEQPVRIEHGDERLRIEPDIGWMARHWFSDAPGDVVSGEDAWSHIRRRLLSAHDGMGARSAALDRLQARVGSLGEGAWDFAAVDVFLAATESELRATVERELWRTDPHHWWLTRLLKAELRLRAGLPYDADKLYRATRDELDTRGLVDATPPDRVRQEPYAVRLARAEASNVISTAEEFTDWVLDADAIRQGVRPFLPEAPANSSAIVVRFEGRRGSYRLHEPNPRRTANMLGRFFGRVPRYLEADRQAVAIAPPPGMIDQRLLRQPGEETPLEEIPAGADAMFRFPLASSRVRDHVSRELASPRYVLAPDLLPVVFDGSAARSTSFGYLDGRNRVWVLRASDARALASRLKGPYQLAAFYRLEIHTDLGSPAWLSALVDGKASRLPTASPVAFRWLLHACRTTTGPIVLYASPDAELGGILTDGNDRPLACEVYVTALQ